MHRISSRYHVPRGRPSKRKMQALLKARRRKASGEIELEHQSLHVCENDLDASGNVSSNYENNEANTYTLNSSALNAATERKLFLLSSQTSVEHVIRVREDYFTKKLFEFATSNRSSVTVFYDKIREKSSNFTENDLKDLSNNLLKINSGDHTYIIKTDVGVCSCPSGSTGAFCKHQCAVMELKKIRLPNAPPVTPEDKHELALLALGPKCPPKNFFCNFKNQLSSANV
ncbi:SWIM-type domain-containing protein [Trichonephila clavata]|uniref:SWIM-type domain-containing protein n=1 Tax=Trichonephila clavata TaxID=2740835 RepID=A0A8X6GKP9_TRICU|nr:SWIM-type domain-containing protein [Trichonephila clavata]